MNSPSTNDSNIPHKVLIAKPGLDGHDRGAKIIARALRDAGMEVLYTGLHQTADSIVRAAVDEDVDAIGVSILSGAHMTVFPAILNALRSEGAEDIVVFGGGIIPDEDAKLLIESGVSTLFSPGAHTDIIVEWIRGNVPRRRMAAPRELPKKS
jgi:methylmalonyl-CoA mutase, C-terminal domain